MKETALIITLSLMVTACSCFSPREQKEPSKALCNKSPIGALIIKHKYPTTDFSDEHIEKSIKLEAIQILDHELIEELEEFFPNYKKNASSNWTGGWLANYTVYFHFNDESVISIPLAQYGDEIIWSTGDGDLETKGDFDKFVEKVESLY